MASAHSQYSTGHVNIYSDRILVGNWSEERAWPSTTSTAARRFEGASTSNSTYGAQIGLQKPIYRRKDWDNVYHCAGKDTILAPSPLPQSFTPSYYATLQQLSYGDPKAAQHKVHAFLWAGHKEADMLNRVPATTTALTSLKKRAWQEEAALDVWDTSSHTAARSGACLPAAACKRQCCRPYDQLGEPPQPGQKAMGAFVQQFDATWRKIGLREAKKGVMVAKAAPLPAPLPASA